MAKCEHGKERTRCRDCGGGSICNHDRARQNCSVCSPEKVFEAYKYKSKGRGLSFSLTPDQFEKIIAAPCQYCGENLEPRGVDRKDSRIGYVPWNCQSLCWICNQLKSCGRRPGQPENERAFLAHVLKIANHQEKLRKQKQMNRGGTLAPVPDNFTGPSEGNPMGEVHA